MDCAMLDSSVRPYSLRPHSVAMPFTSRLALEPPLTMDMFIHCR